MTAPVFIRRSAERTAATRVVRVRYRGETVFHVGPVPSRQTRWEGERRRARRLAIRSTLLLAVPVVAVLLGLLAVLPS